MVVGKQELSQSFSMSGVTFSIDQKTPYWWCIAVNIGLSPQYHFDYFVLMFPTKLKLASSSFFSYPHMNLAFEFTYVSQGSSFTML